VAIYHLSIKIISRAKGKSAVAAAAYRAGEKICNERDGKVHDYTRKGGIVHTEILLPKHAPREYADRATLWNAVEKCERYKTAQLAREIEIALPVELTREENIALAQRYVKENFVNAGMCADVCIHDVDGTNPHAHVMLTMRPIEQDGKWGQKSRTVDGIKVPTVDWNEHDRAEDWRKAWADMCNAYLERGNHTARIDHRSFAIQGIEQVPTIHLGVAASQMEQKGVITDRGNINREIEISNKELRQLRARHNKLQAWLYEEMQNTAPPTLADIISSIAQRRGGIYGLENMLEFCTANNIMDMAGLDDKFKSMISEQSRISNELKPIDKKLAELDEHIKQSGIYQKYHSYKAKYDKLNAEHKTLSKEKGFGAWRKAQKALDAANHYYETNRMEITLCTTAERHLKANRNSEGKIPLLTWKAEREKIAAERNKLGVRYQNLKAETAKAEKIRSNIYDVMSAERRREQPQRSHGLEL